MPRGTKPRGMGGVYQRGATYWIRYWHRGERFSESSNSTKESDAWALLKKRQGEIGIGRHTKPDAQRLTLEGLRKLLLKDYADNGQKSADRAAASMDHLEDFFGKDTRTIDITMDWIVEYVDHRRDEGAAPATIVNELAALKRGFNIAIERGTLTTKPVFPKIKVDNVREGFFEERDFLAVCEHLDESVRPLARFLRHVGWRSGEGKRLEWSQVDLAAGVIRIDRFHTKGKKPRTLPYHALPELVELINEQRDRADAIQREKSVIVTHVFFWPEGSPIRSFRSAWDRACKAAKVTRLPHDMRRTAARDLSRRGVPEKVIMGICGWKTRSVFDRYNIVNEADLAAGLAKMEGPGPAVLDERGRLLRMRTGTEPVQKRVGAKKKGGGGGDK